MRVARLRIEGFRGIRSGEFLLHPHSVVVGPNGSGKSTLIDALSLVLGRAKMVRALTEHDFTGSDPKPADRIRIIATITGFGSSDPDDHTDWFRMGRAVPKWIDAGGELHTTPGDNWELAAQIGCAARFDHAELTVDVIRYFHDDADVVDPFVDDTALEQVPMRLLNDLGYYVLPARRSWEGVTSFNSELFRRTVSNAAGIPATEILAQRDQLRSPERPLEESAALAGLAQHINEQLAKLMPGGLRFMLRVTSGDSEAVLQALLPHYANATSSLPASRHGMGLVSLQTLLLLLEVGRARKAKGLPFMLALEEPELHLAPGLQVRLVAAAIAISDQTICTTHSPRVAAVYQPADTFVMTSVAGLVAAKPLLSAPLTTAANNNERKLFIQNRARVVEALMHPYVLVPEGRFDAEWLRRLADLGEPGQQDAPFSTIYGVVPTENAAVVFTIDRLGALRSGIIGVVDGDPAGDGYVRELSALSRSPHAAVQWPQGWTIEDVVSWVAEPAASAVVAAVASDLGPTWQVQTLAELILLLKTPNDRRAQTLGLKEDVVAHDFIAAALAQHPACVARAAEVCDCLVHIALGHPHRRAVPADPTAAFPRFRFDPM